MTDKTTIPYRLVNQVDGAEICTVSVTSPLQIDERLQGVCTVTDLYVVKEVGRIKNAETGVFDNAARVLCLQD